MKILHSRKQMFAFYARVPAWNFLCQFYCKTIYCRTRDFQHLFSKAVCGRGDHCGGVYVVSAEGTRSSVCISCGVGIY